VLTEENPTASGNTCDDSLTPDVPIYEGCAGGSYTRGPESVFSFTPSQSGTYNLSVDPLDGGLDAVLTIGPLCADPGNDGEWCAFDFVFEGLFFDAGTTYFIVVDSWASSVDPDDVSCGPFTLELTRVD
jgi:hypothetical protein